MGGRVGAVDLDARIMAKWYFSDFNVNQLYHIASYRIMQLIFRNRSYWKCSLRRIMTGACYMFCSGRSNNVLLSRFGFGFVLTFMYLPVSYTYTCFIYISHIHISNTYTYLIRIFFEARESCTEGLQWWYVCLFMLLLFVLRSC